MKKIILISFLLFISSNTFSNDWISPIDKKYSNQYPKMHLKYSKARKLIDTWSGNKEKLNRAGELLKQIVDKEPDFAPVYREFSRLYIRGGYINYDIYKESNLNSAESFILKSIEIEPEYADAYVSLGLLYTTKKKFKDANLAFSKAEEIGTEIPWLMVGKGDLLKIAGKFDEALKYYQIVMDSDTSNKKAYISALSEITLIYVGTGQYDKAKEGYLKQIDYEPKSAWKLINYSNFLLFTYNDVDGAIENGRKSLSIMDFGMGRFILSCALYTKWALLLQQSNKNEEADKYFKMAKSVYPYTENIIKETKKYYYTKQTAIELEKILKNKL